MSLEKEILEMKNSLRRIETAITGDEQMGTKGILHVQKDQALRIDDLEEFKEKQKLRDAKIAGGVLGVGAILQALWHWLNSK